MRRIVIVGGGFTGASAAIQLLRRGQAGFDVTIVEPKSEIGRGLAYSTDDPDHRLNAPMADHFVDPLDLQEFQRWCSAENILESDPGALAPNGAVYARRSDFGRFVWHALEKTATNLTSGSHFQHIVDNAIDLVPNSSEVEVETQRSGTILADAVILATGNAQPRLPPPFEQSLFFHPSFIGSPTDLECLRSIPSNARILVIGTGLTALDVISTLVRRGHQASIVAVSRRGLRPRSPKAQYAPPSSPQSLLQRIEGPVAPFISDLGSSPTALALLRALRARIGSEVDAGRDWYGPFDELRDAASRVWPSMTVLEKHRFLRLLRPWYDAHRFRTPPQNEAIVRDAEQRGVVQFRASRILGAIIGDNGKTVQISLRGRSENAVTQLNVDVVINCTGLDVASGSANNPMLASLLTRGIISRDNSTMGFAVDGQCRAIDEFGQPAEWLRIFGPPTAGTFGDPIGSPFIAAHIHRVLPDILRAVRQKTSECLNAS